MSATHRIVILGGGYGGLQTALKLAESSRNQGKVKPEVLLIDQHGFHLKKVLLFKGALDETPLKASFERLEQLGITFRQARVVGIDPHARILKLAGLPEEELHYDQLVLAIGSKLTEASPELGGISLSGPEQATRIKHQLHKQLVLASSCDDMDRLDTMLSVAIIGGGLSGIETAAEIASWLRKEKERRGIRPEMGQVHLIHTKKRLLMEAPSRVSRKLESQLVGKLGIHIHHSARAERFADEHVLLQDRRQVPAATCVWTLGMEAHPILRAWGLPVDERGRILVDTHYRVEGHTGLYAIGDCARVLDPNSGREDGMTCREATAQGIRLASILMADQSGAPAPQHAPAIFIFCLSLGPGQGFVWSRKWGLDLVLTGSLGWKMRKYTWGLADLLS